MIGLNLSCRVPLYCKTIVFAGLHACQLINHLKMEHPKSLLSWLTTRLCKACISIFPVESSGELFQTWEYPVQFLQTFPTFLHVSSLLGDCYINCFTLFLKNSDCMLTYTDSNHILIKRKLGFDFLLVNLSYNFKWLYIVELEKDWCIFKKKKRERDWCNDVKHLLFINIHVHFVWWLFGFEYIILFFYR